MGPPGSHVPVLSARQAPRIAAKRHAELVNTLDLIGVLPPGLYEMILEEEKADDVGADLLPGQYLVRLRRRVGGRNLNAMGVGFQYLADAHGLLAELKQRLEAFALKLHPLAGHGVAAMGKLL